MKKPKETPAITEDSIIDAMEELTDLRDKIKANEERFEGLVLKLLGSEKVKKMDRLQEELHEQNRTVLEKAKLIEEEIRQKVGKHGRNVESNYLLAVYNKPKIKWNHDMLEGMVAFHPEIGKARTVDKYGSCQIRTKKEE